MLCKVPVYNSVKDNTVPFGVVASVKDTVNFNVVDSVEEDTAKFGVSDSVGDDTAKFDVKNTGEYGLEDHVKNESSCRFSYTNGKGSIPVFTGPTSGREPGKSGHLVADVPEIETGGVHGQGVTSEGGNSETTRGNLSSVVAEDVQCQGGASDEGGFVTGEDNSGPSSLVLEEVQGQGVASGVAGGATLGDKSQVLGNCGIGNSEVGRDLLRREVLKCSGVYVHGHLHGSDVVYTVDTGAATTVVSRKVYDNIARSRRPDLVQPRRSNMLTGADGNFISCLGKGVFNMEIGPVLVTEEVSVADISDEILLGNDVLLKQPEGPADLLLSENRMVLKGKSVPLVQVGAPVRERRVRAADHIVIPGMSEMILDVYMDIGPKEDEGMVLIEGKASLACDHSLLMAPTLVDVASNNMAQVRVMNPFEDPRLIKQDMVVGVADTVHVIYNDPGSSPVREVQVADNVGNTVPSHLKDLYDSIIVGKCQEDQDAIKSLLIEYADIFSRHDLDLGLTNLVEHTIDVGDAKPVKQPPRRVPLAFAGEDRKALQMWEDQGSIRPSSSPWASPMVFVRKKDGSTRCCIDFRKVNECTKKDAYPLPRTQDCLDSLAGAVWFSTMDITSAYNQIKVKEEDIPKTAFVSKYGLFEYTTMPFGLCTAPATFQRVMELALSGLQWNTCLIYLDDVIVFASSLPEMITRLRDVLSRIRKAGLKLKPSKCHLFQEEVKFLGHVVNGNGVLPDPDNISKIVKWEIPRDVTGVRVFLGMGNYYRRFIESYAQKAHPLTELTKKDRPFVWTPECQEAFDLLKSELVGPDILALPRDEGLYILDTDACGVSIGAVLSQVQDSRERVIAYGSKSLCKAEKNYCVTDRELLAIKFFLERYKHYLLGRKFLVRSDHQALKWLFSLKEPKGRIARWIEQMSAFDFMVEFRSGKKHENADSMSRCPNVRDCQCPADLEENLVCGPCPKCQKRSVDMESSMTANVSVTRRVSSDLYNFPWTSLWSIVVWVFLLPFQVLNGVFCQKKLENGSSFTGRDSDILPGMMKDDGRLWPKLKLWLQRPVISCLKGLPILAGGTPPVISCIRKTRQDESWALPYTMSKLRVKQLDDPDIKPVLQWKESGTRPLSQTVGKASPATRHYWNLWNTLEIRDGVLFHKFQKKDGTGEYVQFLVPRAIRDEILHQMHDSILSGHLGRKKTKDKILQRFYWFGLKEDVYNYIARCHPCGEIKQPPKSMKAPLGSMMVGAPLDRLSTDVLGPLPETERGNKFILVVTDNFTKWVEIFPIPDQTAVTCAEVILNEVIARYGCPYDLHSDQGKNFESEVFKELCQLLEIRKTRTSPANPRCNGQCERFNRTLIRMVKAYIKGQQREWDKNLGCLAAAYRATPHESTGMTPNLLMLGREVRFPAEIMFGSGTTHVGEEVSSYGQYIDELKSRLHHAHSVARQHLGVSAKRQKQCYDIKQKLCTYHPGDLVWYQTNISQLHIAPKLRKPYEGPYVVVNRFNDLNYMIQMDPKGKKRVVHHNKLKLYQGDIKLRWAKSAVQMAKRI